jgi:hypothetical protein
MSLLDDDLQKLSEYFYMSELVDEQSMCPILVFKSKIENMIIQLNRHVKLNYELGL